MTAAARPQMVLLVTPALLMGQSQVPLPARWLPTLQPLLGPPLLGPPLLGPPLRPRVAQLGPLQQSGTAWLQRQGCQQGEKLGLSRRPQPPLPVRRRPRAARLGPPQQSGAAWLQRQGCQQGVQLGLA